MPNLSVACYLSSLIFYGLGYSKAMVIENAVNTFDYTINVSIATGYFVFAIVLTVIGSLFFFVMYTKEQEVAKIRDIELRIKSGRQFDAGRRRGPLTEVEHLKIG